MGDSKASDISNEEVKKSKLVKIYVLGLIATGIIVAAILLFLRYMDSKKDYRIVFEKYAQAVMENDAKIYTQTMSKDVLDYIEKRCESLVDIEFEEQINMRNQNYRDTYGDDFKIKIKYIQEYKCDREQLKSINKNLSSKEDYNLGEVTKAYQVSVKMKIEGSKYRSVVLSTETIVKVDDKWVFLFEL